MNLIFKFIKSTDIRILLVCLAAMLLLSLSASGQCTLACSSDINVTINPQNCEAYLSTAHFSNTQCPGDFLIEIMDGDDVIAEGTNQVVIRNVGNFIFKLTLAGQAPCWGNIHVKDEFGPVYNPQFNPEPVTEVCGQLLPDPSGITDLKTELVSCVVQESGFSIEPWFDVLKKYDFLDCEEVASLHHYTITTNYCEEELEKDLVFPEGWMPYEIHTRYWYAEDIQGRKSDTVSQDVVSLRPIADAIYLEDIISFGCSDDPTIGIGPSFIDLTNGPDFYTCPVSSGQKVFMTGNSIFCGYLISTKADTKIAICSNDVNQTYKQNIHWDVVDWCSGEFVLDDERQLVEVKDRIAPTVIKGSVDFTSDAFQCSGTLNVGPASTAGFECTEVSWTTLIEYGEISFENGFFNRIELEQNGATGISIPAEAEVKITWTATDACGNQDTKLVMRSPLDQVAPVCIANDAIIVGLITDDPIQHTLAARVYAEDIDDTSYDNCQQIVRRIRRHDHKLAYLAAGKDIEDLWAPYVEFTHEDLKNGACEADILVDFLVREKRKGGLRSECISLVTIENKNVPVVKAPEDQNVDCKQHIPGFGTPTIWGACNSSTTEVVKILIDDNCRYDTTYHAIKIWTPFTIVDGAKHYGIADTQSIVVINVHDVKFNFPPDLLVDCTAAGSLPAQLSIEDILEDNGCGQWKLNVTDKYYDATDKEDCQKIIREYEFINWCTWEYTRSEIAVVNRPDELLLNAEEAVNLVYKDRSLKGKNEIDDKDDMDVYDDTNLTFDGMFVRIDNPDNVPGVSSYPISVDGDVINFVDGYRYGKFVYRQIIKVEDNIAPELYRGLFEVNCNPESEECKLVGEVSAKLVYTDDCSDVELSYLFIEAGTSTPKSDPYGSLNKDLGIITGKYPSGKHVFVVSARDGCNNITTKHFDFNVRKECKKPTPVCIANFTALMENGEVEVWASDINSGSSYDNCTSPENLIFAIQKIHDLDGDLRITTNDIQNEMPSASNVLLTCADGEKTYVALWVKDEAGNTQFCITPLFITDNNGKCDGAYVTAKVSGEITNEADESIDDVMITLNKSGGASSSSPFNGAFNFDVPMHQNITIQPVKNDFFTNGVSTADLVSLQRHILGVKELNTAYNIIAADVSGDDKIDTRDMLHLSRLILGVYDELPNNSSWRFVDKNHQFQNPTSPWGFKEVIELNNLEEDQGVDFIGIKVGDVTGNANPSNLLGNETQLTPKEITIPDQVIKAGKVETISFLAKDFDDWSGYQFTIQLNEGVSLQSVQAGVLPNLGEANFGLNKLENGIITTSWANAEALNLEDGAVLFTINIVSDRETRISNMIQMTSSVTTAESYDDDLNVYALKLNFLKKATGELVLHQNTPNPFNGTTVIGFELPEADNVSMKVMDISGRSLKLIQGNYGKGYHTVELSSSELESTGVLYYELTTSKTSITKKMVVIE